MTEERSLPAVVIVGRPNVGKSTLFNAIIGQRKSIVGDEPGITRDRIYGEGTYFNRPFALIDTGGIIPNDEEMIPTEIFKQARVALEEAAHIIFVIDGRTEITGIDRDLARLLKQLGKPVSLAVNKIDTLATESLTNQFYGLGFSDVFSVSAEHRMGFDDLRDHVTGTFPSRTEEEPKSAKPTIRVAIIGRPNVGKSTLLNALVGSERAIVSPVAGTTRDAVDETVETDGATLVFVDTAGIRRKGKTKLMAEKMSVVMARRNIRMAHVVVVLLDATEGVLSSDATIAGYAHEEGRALIVCVNKWDTAANKSQKDFTQSVRDELKFLDYAPVAYLSAKTGYGVQRLFGLIQECYEAASKRITTGELNRFMEMVRFEGDVKLFYITQGSIRPPAFTVFTDKGEKLHFSSERFLVNQLRKRFGFQGTPIVIKSRRR